MSNRSAAANEIQVVHSNCYSLFKRIATRLKNPAESHKGPFKQKAARVLPETLSPDSRPAGTLTKYRELIQQNAHGKLVIDAVAGRSYGLRYLLCISW